ncbi:MAG: isoprenylcysteine carboxylmethyltransferase family protein [Phycisphaerales bacterium]|nr:isoprenylcysteine carboxylmethyltransferase family protein [Phycisphaerales bacterium]
MKSPPIGWRLWGRSPGDLVLFGVTAVELAILVLLAEGLSPTDWVYVCSNLLVLVIALVRRPAQVQDRSTGAGIAVLVSYTYSYAQVMLLQWHPGHVGAPEQVQAAKVLVIIGASLSLVGLISLGRFFGVRPAMRGLSTRGTYRLVRHPLYVSYVIQDIGYNLHEWSVWTLILVAVGWGSMIYRIRAEERVLSQNAEWAKYAERVKYRLVPGVW